MATNRAPGQRKTPGIADAKQARVNSQSRYTGTTTMIAAERVAFWGGGDVKESVSVTFSKAFKA